ncbi:hypothetical protein J2W35_001698 [Variovorax boronicumulans]|nr:hypothetical protein [Variovorax boronicumulans]
MASVAIVTAQRERVFMSLNGTGNNNGGEKRTGLQRTPHRDPGVGGLHVFTTEAAMIRTAGVPGNACAVCTFPKAAMPEIQGLAAIALHHAKQTCARPNARRQALRPSMTFMRPPRSPWTPQVPASPAPR